MSVAQWFVAVDRVQLEGQFTSEQVGAMVAERPDAKVMVWRAGMAAWAAAGDVSDLVSAQAAVPATRAPNPPATPPAAVAPAPAAGRAGSTERSRPERARPAEATTAAVDFSFLKGLLDVRFERLIGPRMVSVIYVVAMVVVVIALVGMIVSAFSTILLGLKIGAFIRVAMGLGLLVLAPILAVLYLALFRVLLELVVVLFRLKDNTDALLKQ